MPTNRARIQIMGLAYCHIHNKLTGTRNSGELQTLFLQPEDNRHEFQLLISEIVGTTTTNRPVITIPAGTEIRLNAVSSDPVQANSAFDDIVNIDRIHYPPADFENFSQPPTNFLRFKRPTGIPLSYLSIPNARCYCPAVPSTRYDFWRIFGTTTKIHQRNRVIGPTLATDFDINVGGLLEFTFRTEDPAQAIPSQYVRYKVNTRYEIVFQNDCPSATCLSDFRYYYKLVDGLSTEFELTPPFPPLPNPHSDKEAACNPAVGDPPNCTPEQLFNGSCPP